MLLVFSKPIHSYPRYCSDCCYNQLQEDVGSHHLFSWGLTQIARHVNLMCLLIDSCLAIWLWLSFLYFYGLISSLSSWNKPVRLESRCDRILRCSILNYPQWSDYLLNYRMMCSVGQERWVETITTSISTSSSIHNPVHKYCHHHHFS